MKLRGQKFKALPTSLLKALQEDTGIIERVRIEFFKVPFVLNYSCGLRNVDSSSNYLIEVFLILRLSYIKEEMKNLFKSLCCDRIWWIRT